MAKFRTKFIGASYRGVIRPIYFLMDPEKIHNRMIRFGHWLGKYKFTKGLTKWAFNYEHPLLEQNIANISFKNPIGLSAGFDKDADLLSLMPDVGFGYMQVGSITDKPYLGNPGTRLYRLKESKGIVVYYGLKNLGATEILKKIESYGTIGSPYSISIAKTNSNETCETEAGIQDYYDCFNKVIESGLGNFYTLNISCPNVFGGEPFTTPEKLNQLLDKVSELNLPKPLFLKMPINLEWEAFNKLLEVAINQGVAGVIIGNLNKDHKDPAIKDEIPANIKGGISGKPTWKLSNDLISQTYKNYGKRLAIVGVGGVFSAEDAYEKIKRGASLVQLITGMIYRGPQLIGEINQDLVELLKKDGHKNISEAVGSYFK